MTSNLIHETVVRLGQQRGQPRYFVNARYLSRAGFSGGQWISILIGDSSITIRPTKEPSGKRVQEKNGHPLIDLNAKFLAEVFGANRNLQVRVTEKEIALSVHKLDAMRDERPRDGSMGSLFSGAGLLDQAGVNAGFTAKWAVEIDRNTAETYAENHREAAIYEMSVHEAAFSMSLTPVELLVLGLPCQPWARCRTLNADGSKLDRSRPATEHPLGDMAFWAFLIVSRVNPRTVVLECAPGFKDRELWASLTGALQRLGYLKELAAHMRAAGVERLELQTPVGYSFSDDHYSNEGEFIAIEFEDGELRGVDDDMRISLDNRTPHETLAIAESIVWPKGKSGVIVSRPA